MKKPLHRAKRLFDVQHQLYRMELSKLQASQQSLWQAQKAELDALAALGGEQSSAMPSQLAARIAALSNTKVHAQRASVETQMEQTLDLARKEHVARRRLENERTNLEKQESKVALEAAIDAFLGRKRF
jgi:hypothetical protein